MTIEIIEKALVYLDSCCDGAVEEDNKGFNGGDSFFGKSLSKQIREGRSLTQKQAEIAHKMLIKYKGQLANAGLILPKDLPVVAHKVTPGVRSGEVSLTPSYQKSIGLINDKYFQINFQYDKFLVEKIKSIPGVACTKSMGKWIWHLPLDQHQQISEILELGFELEENTRSHLEKLAKRQEKRKEKVKHRVDWCLNYLKSSDEIKFTPYKHQWEAVETFLNYENLKGLITDLMGLGKAQINTSLVLTPSGYKQMGDIRKGEFVIGSDGLPTLVTGVYPQGVVECFKVIFSDDSSLDVCGDHLWQVEERIHAQKHVNKVKTTKQILRTGFRDKTNYIHRIPMVKPVEFEYKANQIDAYAMGYILGNGCMSQDSGLKISTRDPEIVEFFKQFLKENMTLEQSKTNQYDWSFRGRGSKNWIREELNNLGLSNARSETKFIPHNYLYTDFEDRLAIFQGLMDSDGSFSPSTAREKTGNLEYSSSSLQLALDVRFLVESFGGIVHRYEKEEPKFTYKGEQRTGQKHYRLNISLPNDIQPFRLSRKLGVYQPRTKYQPTRFIKDIQPIGYHKATCICVEAVDKLYVADRFIVTHNTMEGLLIAKAVKAIAKQNNIDLRIFIVCPVTLKLNWLEEAASVSENIEVFSYAKIPTPPESQKYIIIFDECFLYDTVVMTEKGLMKIGDIVEDKIDVKILSKTESGDLEYRKINRWIKCERKTRLIKIQYSDGLLVCTENHKIYTQERGYVRANQIKSGETMLKLQSNFLDTDKGESYSKVLQQIVYSKLSASYEGRKNKTEIEQEKYSFNCVRVESVTFLEQGMQREYGLHNPTNYVYNLEIDINHNYFAESILVSNCHLCQNMQSQRTKKAIALSKHKNCAALIGLTGTPLKNGRPINLLPLLTMIDHPLAVNKSQYEKTYCDAKRTSFSPWDTSGATNLEQLNKKIADRVIRRTKEECLDLPEKTYQTIYCDDNKEAETAYQTKLDQLQDEYERRLQEGEISEGGEAIVKLTHLRVCASLYKSFTSIEKAEEILEQGDQVVIFTEFKDSAHRIAQHFGVTALTGDVKIEDRQKMKDDFQNGINKVFVGTIKAGGVGITLTKANYLIMNDLPWTTADYDQSTDRIHRIGQKNTCIIYDIIGKDVDYVMLAILGKKKDVTEKVLKKVGLKDMIENSSQIDYKKILEALTK